MQRCLTVGAQVTLIQVNSSTRIPRSLPASFLFVPIRYRFQVSLFKPLKPLTPNQLSRGSPPGTATLRPPSSLSLSLSLSVSLTLSLSLSLVGLLQVPRRCARHSLSAGAARGGGGGGGGLPGQPGGSGRRRGGAGAAHPLLANPCKFFYLSPCHTYKYANLIILRSVGSHTRQYHARCNTQPAWRLSTQIGNVSCMILSRGSSPCVMRHSN
jgi:hypothetical protein